ncbi:MAG: hypothetical protein M0P58_02600 [Bacteroidales bacterium]|jgi:hypothetical protein|nr:hypothetical protein [Bacteroidales bacterium]
MIRKIVAWIFSFVIVFTFSISCKKTLDTEKADLPPWEDKSSDSATLEVTVETQYGIFMTGAYLNLALSNDSLNNKIWVRRSITDGAGHVVFSRLYPRIYYANCYVYLNGYSYYGSFNIKMPPQSIKDTLLYVH